MRVQIIPVCLAVALMASGCDDKSTPPAVDGGVPAGPARVLTTLKDEKPYILMDMSPELGTFKSLQGTERETFLLRRAGEGRSRTRPQGNEIYRQGFVRRSYGAG